MNTGIIFAWDGVLVDSYALHEKSWELLADRHNLLLPRDFFFRSFGRKNERIISEILNWAADAEEVEKYAIEKEEIFSVLVREQGIDALPGARVLLQGLLEEKIACGIVTSTPRRNLDVVLKALNLGFNFDAIVAGEALKGERVMAEDFIFAAEKLGLAPQECICVSPLLGDIEAALRCGLKTAGIAQQSNFALFERAGTHIVVSGVNELSLSTFRALQRI